MRGILLTTVKSDVAYMGVEPQVRWLGLTTIKGRAGKKLL
jgi:hypothetical protein